MDSETVTANLLEPVVGLDRDGTVVFANDRFLRVTGTAREALLGEEFEALGKFVGEGFPSLRSAVERAQEGATGDTRVDGTMRHPESAPVPRTLPVEFRVTPVVEDGVRRGVLVILRDISERVLDAAADRLGAYTMPLPSSSRAMMFFWISVVPS